MSLQQVVRAEEIGRARDNPAALAALDGQDLSEVRSEAGCNMLLVYLLNRWGRLFEPGHPATVAQSEDFHTKVVEAYLRAGCSGEDEVPSRELRRHTPPSFNYQVKLTGKLSARTFVGFMLRELHPEMYPEAYAQLQRLMQQLTAPGSAPAELPEPALTETYAIVLCGVHWTGRFGDFDHAGALSEQLRVVIAGDHPNLPRDDVRDLVVGVVRASASASAGQPVSIELDASASLSPKQQSYLEQHGRIRDYLVATGPLASAVIARGDLGGAGDGRPGRFITGADMGQEPHPVGVWGDVVTAVTAGVKTCELDGTGLHLIARYD